MKKKWALIKKAKARTKNNHPQTFLLEKVPKTGINNEKTKTTSKALPVNIFRPNPIGNNWIKGTKITSIGMLNAMFKGKFDLLL